MSRLWVERKVFHNPKNAMENSGLKMVRQGNDVVKTIPKL